MGPCFSLDKKISQMYLSIIILSNKKQSNFFDYFESGANLKVSEAFNLWYYFVKLYILTRSWLL